MATTGGLDQAQIAVLDLRTGTHKTLIPGGSDAHYVPSGHLVYGAAGTLARRRLRPRQARRRRHRRCRSVPQVVTTTSGAVDVAVAGDGTLVYLPGVGGRSTCNGHWSGSTGRARRRRSPRQPRTYEQPRISPDGDRVAIHAAGPGGRHLGCWTWSGGTLPRAHVRTRR